MNSNEDNKKYQKFFQNNILLILKIVITIVLVAFLIFKVKWFSIFEIFRHLNVGLYGLAFLLILLGMFISTIKWQLLLKSINYHEPFWQLFRYYYIGAFFNIFLPSVIGGDAVRATLLRKDSSLILRNAVSIFVERFLGFIVLLTIASVSFLLNYHLFAGTIAEAIMLVVIAVNFLLILLFFCPKLIKILSKPVYYILSFSRFTSLLRLVNQIAEALGKIRNNKKNIFFAVLLSLAFQLVVIICYVVVLFALGVDINPLYIFTLYPIVMVIVMLPISINGIGLREWASIFIYGLVGVNRKDILALSLAVYLLLVVNSFIGGFFYLIGSPKKIKQ
jgi:glycosyltransferase 2 family protein